MPDYFHSLKKQIDRYLKSIDLTQSPWPEFLGAVDKFYKKLDAQRKAIEDSLTESSEELVRANDEMYAVFQAIPDQLFHFSDEGRVISYQTGTNSHHYLTADKLINQSIADIIRSDIADMFLKAIREVIKNKVVSSFEFVAIFEQKIYYYEARLMPVKGLQVVALIRDITERKLAEDQIAFLAYHDGLTGLPNNLLFKERLEQGIASAQRSNSQLAVMFLDLDRFKLINDSMGHDVGDQ
ncbi:MAG: diguanylate cyclase domain-containing protein, partial [Gammaproteobacteria bacterium]